ncbi:MAG TPA: hypothetical protein VJ570_09990 [Holophagaceae bacterium]|nr:hypothetical protein [Holophagaceae bacterium]
MHLLPPAGLRRWFFLALLCLLGPVGCRPSLVVPDRKAPRTVSFAIAPGVEDPGGLRADLEEAFQARWKVVPEQEPILIGEQRLQVEVAAHRLDSRSSRGPGRLAAGGLLAAVSASIWFQAEGWASYNALPIAGVAIPLVATGLAETIRTRRWDRRRGYPLPALRVRLRLATPADPRPRAHWAQSQDFRELALPLEQELALDPRQRRRGCVIGLERYVALEAGLLDESFHP